MKCKNAEFRPVIQGCVSGTEKVRYKWDVGICQVEKNENQAVTGWRWIFHLKDFSRHEATEHSVLFGEVFDDDRSVIKSLSSKKIGERADLAMYIKVRPAN